jgi:LuxR family glucitol operon transcriptional activator
MSQLVKQLRVFLASPGDVTEERQIAIEILERLQSDPAFRDRIAIQAVAWDKRGAAPPMLANLTPQDAISQGLPLPCDCDIVIVIFWSRIGTPLPPQYKRADDTFFRSGTEWEFENAVNGCRNKGRPSVLLYRRMEKLQISPDDAQAQEKFSQYMAVQSFFDAFITTGGVMKGGYNQYQTVRDFKEALEGHLRQLLPQLLEERDHENLTVDPSQLPSPSPSSPRSRHNLPPRIYGELLGRKDDIDRVLTGLESRYPVITIEGFAGVGKTSLAVEVGYSCLISTDKTKVDTITFDFVVWVSAKDKPRQQRWFDDVLNTTARVMEYLAVTQLPKEQTEQKLLEIDSLLRSHRVLLIIDNFETIKDRSLMKWIERVPEPSKVLITSRRRQFPMSLPVDLEGLPEVEALELIRRHAHSLGLSFITAKPDEELMPLIQYTGANPQAIVMSLGIIKGGTLALEEVIKGLQTNYKNKNLNNVFQHLFAASWRLLSPNARKVLLAVPLFSGASSIRRDALRAASGVLEDEFDQALAQLVEFKLLQVDFKSTRYIAHPMTHTFATIKLSKTPSFEKAARQRWGKYFLQFLEENIVREKPPVRYWNALVSDKMGVIDAEWPSLQEVLKWAEQQQQDKLLLDLLVLLVHYMDSRFLNLERMTYIKKAVRIARAMGHKEEEALLRMDALGWTYVEEDNLDEAYEEIMRGFNIVTQYRSEIETAEDLTALGFAWRARVRIEQKQPEEANQLIGGALNLACSPWIKSRVYMAAGDIALKQNNSKDALHFYEEAAESIEDYGGEGHGYQVDPRIGLAYLSLGNLDEARARFNALRANEAIPIGKLYGDYGLAMVAYKENRKEEARRLADETRKSLTRRTSSNLLLKLTNQLFLELDDDKQMTARLSSSSSRAI